MKTSYRLSKAAEVVQIEEQSALAKLRGACLVTTYTVDGEEYVTEHALRDLEQRLAVPGADCNIGVFRGDPVEVVRAIRASKPVVGGTLEAPNP